jgi:hypothetical protein
MRSEKPVLRDLCTVLTLILGTFPHKRENISAAYFCAETKRILILRMFWLYDNRAKSYQNLKTESFLGLIFFESTTKNFGRECSNFRPAAKKRATKNLVYNDFYSEIDPILMQF